MENIAYYLNNISLLTYVVVFFAGVMTSFTPCIFPLVPIVASVIGGVQGGGKSRLRGFMLSLIYVFGMAITFSILGTIAAMTGRLFGQVQSNPITYLIVGNVIIFFALVLLDVIHLPVFLLNRVGLGKITRSHGVFSVLFMGMISGLIASPCAAAILGALLAFVATTQNAVLGASLLFTYAIGLGTLLIIIGTFSGLIASIPRSAKIMKIVQKVFAFGMILLGEYFIFKAGILNL
ncbi:MAG: cytochrome c biogenesis protein CcdA [Candidatus Omnitrophota bacterium]|nr:sulfite exporter TauE/SafE family protein [Candidatus Omnitrophota bacterium]MBU1894962.1 sulfite exporter TauE/SafE family protein [Candidatus Omnitrophota bacterium]